MGTFSFLRRFFSRPVATPSPRTTADAATAAAYGSAAAAGAGLDPALGAVVAAQQIAPTDKPGDEAYRIALAISLAKNAMPDNPYAVAEAARQAVHASRPPDPPG